MKKYMSDIYPKELILVPDDTDGKACPFLDLAVKIEDSIISTSLYDKRDAYDFPIVNFPTLTGNIPLRSSYGVFVGELVRYARACTNLCDFQNRTFRLVKKLLRQAFTPILLRKTFNKFCEDHILLVQKYGFHILSLSNQWM